MFLTVLTKEILKGFCYLTERRFVVSTCILRITASCTTTRGITLSFLLLLLLGYETIGVAAFPTYLVVVVSSAARMEIAMMNP